MKWIIKQILPLTYYTKFEQDGQKYFSIWKMWLGKCYNEVKFKIEEA